ncbi:S41 family peptidase [Parapedobacter sp. DT-150]|uniref:S41 family peptidase n=1 Tax=Parapedobacter sp. DT-150 TaxID=3396162 RepID=UPI003F19B4DE
MKKIASLFLVMAMAISAMCQPPDPKASFNLDFENAANGMPIGWSGYGGGEGYTLSLDSGQARSGKYAAVIEFAGEKAEFRAWQLIIPGSYPGRKITLSGYMKTEHVEGFAGLWMRIDPQVAFNNMQQEGIAGTTDWTRYEFTLDMDPEKTERIVLGGLLAGKGKVWIDGLVLTIDGKDISTLKPLEERKLPAQLDTAFDSGSQISLPVLNEMHKENLKVLGLVWGFVKYYHPNVAKGDFNWDYELFRVLPSVVDAGSETKRDDALVSWINKLGPFEKGAVQRPASAKVKHEPDLAWISNSDFSDELTALLLDVKDAKRDGKHFYIGTRPGVGNPDFGSEHAYPTMRADDDGMRLLALYRYWNIIQYFFPYKHLIEEDWKDVLGEFVPRFAEADDPQAYVLTVLELIGRVHDTHANVWGNNPLLNRFFGEKHAPVEVQFVEERAVVTGYRHEEWGRATGLEVGDVITAINGKAVEQVVKDLLKYTPASNYPTQLRDIAPKLLRSNDSTIQVEFVREGGTKTAMLKTFRPDQLTMLNRFVSKDTSFKMISDDIAYVNNGTLNADDLPKFWDKVKQSKGLIIDNRNYPMHFPVHAFSKYLIPKATPFVMFSYGNLQQPGLFVLGASTTAGALNGGYQGKVVILVNEVTQSSAEFHAMAYRVHPNATVIGSTTAGADGDISPIALPGDIRTTISGLGVYYPNGTETQRVGIVPDVEVKPTIKGVKAGRDEALEKAVEFINGG